MGDLNDKNTDDVGTYDSSRLVPIDVEIAFDESIQIFDSEIFNMFQVNKLN